MIFVKNKKAGIPWWLSKITIALVFLLILVYAFPPLVNNLAANIREKIGIGPDDKDSTEGLTREQRQREQQIIEIANSVASCYEAGETGCRGISFTSQVSDITENDLESWLNTNKKQDKDWKILLDIGVPITKERSYDLFFIPIGCKSSSSEYILMRYTGGSDPCA